MNNPTNIQKKRYTTKRVGIRFAVTTTRRWPWSKPEVVQIAFKRMEDVNALLDMLREHEKRIEYLREEVDELSKPKRKDSEV